MSANEQDPVDRLGRLDACAVSDALDRLDLRGAVTGLRRVTGSNVVAGSVATLRLVDDDGGEREGHLGTALLDGLPPGVAIVVANEGRTGVAAWGGLLARAARLRGASGILVDGAVRDVDEIADLGVPVHARAVVPVSARGRIVEATHQSAVEVEGIPVEPGDLVIADGSGVVFVPRNQAERVLKVAEEIAILEWEMARDLEDGKLPSQVMGARYERLTRRDA